MLKRIKTIVLFMISLFLFSSLFLPSADAAKKPSHKVRAKKHFIKKFRQAKKRKAPAVKGISTLKFYVEEGFDDDEGQNMVEEVKGMGAKEAEINVKNNLLIITFDKSKLSANQIIKAFKNLSYTLKLVK